MYEHWCDDCDFCEMNHKSKVPAVCPKCGGYMRHDYDDDSVKHED